MENSFTTDDFLGGKIKLRQPVKGYRATSDAVLLAAAADPQPRQNSMMNALFRIIGFPDIVVNCLHYNSIFSSRFIEPPEKTVTEGITLLVNP